MIVQALESVALTQYLHSSKNSIKCINFLCGLVCIQDGLCKFEQNYLTADFWQYCAVLTATWLSLRFLVMLAVCSINIQIETPRPL